MSDDTTDAMVKISKLFSFISFGLLLLGLTGLGHSLLFLFIIGEAATVAAIACIFRAAYENKFYIFLSAIWFGLASINFARVVFLYLK